jgi:hypothetical protein
MPVAVGITADAYNRPGPTWTPAHVAGMVGWWDATYSPGFLYSTGNDPAAPPEVYVSQWGDRSGQGRHAVGIDNPGYHPKRNVTINGLPAVDFSTGYIAVTKYLTIPAFTTSQTKPMTGAMVVTFPANTADGWYMFGGDGGLVIRVGTALTLNLVVPGVSEIGKSPDGTVVPGETAVVSWSWDAAGVWWIRKNGVLVASGTSATAVAGTAPVAIGSNNSQITIGEILAFTVALSPFDVAMIEQYLIDKWGLPPTADPLSVNWRNAWWAEGPKMKALALADGDPVSVWPDEKGTADWAQPVAASQPMFVASAPRLNGRPGVHPDGVDDFMDGSTLPATNDFTMVAIVAGNDRAWAAERLVSSKDGAGGLAFQNLQSGANDRQFGVSGTSGVSIQYGKNDVVHLMHGRLVSSVGDVHVDFSPPTTRGIGYYWEINNGQKSLFARAITPPDTLVMSPLAFLGIFAGDVTTDPRWPDFCGWANAYYKLWKWPPLAVPGMVAWWDASDSSTFTYVAGAGETVSQWRDKSGNNRHLAQADAARRPQRNGRQNGRPTVVFDGEDDWLDSTSFAVNQPLTIFMVVDQVIGGSGDTQAGYVVSRDPTGVGALTYLSNNYVVFGNAGGSVNSNPVVNAGPHAWTFVANGATSQVFGDGIPGAVGVLGAPGIVGGLRMGSDREDQVDYTLGYKLRGEVCEVIIYSGAVTAVQRFGVLSYLAAKWGTPAPPPLAPTGFDTTLTTWIDADQDALVKDEPISGYREHSNGRVIDTNAVFRTYPSRIEGMVVPVETGLDGYTVVVVDDERHLFIQRVDVHRQRYDRLAEHWSFGDIEETPTVPAFPAIVEQLVYDGPLPDSDLRLLIDYLTNKHGI